jgi:hypothetical protein
VGSAEGGAEGETDGAAVGGTDGAAEGVAEGDAVGSGVAGVGSGVAGVGSGVAGVGSGVAGVGSGVASVGEGDGAALRKLSTSWRYRSQKLASSSTPTEASATLLARAVPVIKNPADKINATEETNFIVLIECKQIPKNVGLCLELIAGGVCARTRKLNCFDNYDERRMRNFL